MDKNKKEDIKSTKASSGVPTQQTSQPSVTMYLPSQQEITESALWSQRFETASTFQQPLFKKWAKWYEDMYAYVSKRPGTAPWRSGVYLPIIASKIWDLIARFIQYRPGWEVSIRSLPVNVLSKESFDTYMEDMNKKLEKVKMALDYDYDCPIREEPIQDELLGPMLDAAVTGQGLGRVPYVARKTDYVSHPTDGKEFVDYSKEVVTTAQEGYNDFQGVNIFNLFIAPQSKGLQKAPWFIIHQFVPKYELEQDGKYKNLQFVAGNATNEFAQYEASRNRLVNSQDVNVLDTTTDMDEASVEAGLECKDDSLAVQSQRDEADINTIVRRFGLSGELRKVFVCRRMVILRILLIFSRQ